MGKITDAAIAVIVLVIGLWVITRLGLTLPAIESMIHKFFFPSGPATTTNATSGFILGIAATARTKTKLKKKIEDIMRTRYLRSIIPGLRRKRSE